MEKLRLRQAVLVEGKYDAIRLSSLLDTVILCTDGFRIFNDADKRLLLRRVAERRGIVLLTDSDAAGFQIRAYVRKLLPKEQYTQVYIPDIFGKERRKAQPSKEGKLGVEGMETQVLLDALRRAGVTDDALTEHAGSAVTKLDLYRDGFHGKPGSRDRLRRLLRRLDLPEHLSTNGLAELLSACANAEEYRATVRALDMEGTQCE
ncbi:MAG: DUF4093 domain-containing protein [Oscillospiraceae bacterium]|jgi:ribonuclease M5|nr:DUF4093 domain-containing protein [Oscillospiraceae bacterium]